MRRSSGHVARQPLGHTVVPPDSLMIDLTERVALVTGASRGIGRAIAMRMAAQGATVVAAARAEHADDTVAAITAAGGRAERIALDVTDPAAIAEATSGLLERHGRIVILVCNAGITRDGLLLRMKRDDWDTVIATNLTAAFALTQAALKPMLRQRSGRMIAVSSVVGQMGNAGQANYAASKAGLIGFYKALGRPGAHRHGHDSRVGRGPEAGLVAADSARPAGHAGRCRGGGVLSCVG